MSLGLLNYSFKYLSHEKTNNWLGKSFGELIQTEHLVDFY